MDQTAWVERLEPGSVHRVRETQIDPAGKGINVSRMAHRLGWPTIAFGFLAGDVGNIVRKALEQEGVPAHFVPVPGQTRINVTVVEGSGTASSFYGPGPAPPPEALASLEGLVRFWLQAGGVLALAGSLPSGVPEDVYARLTRAARERAVKVFLDADGEPLRLGLAAGPSLIKPNVAEAERGRGAVCAQATRAWRIHPPDVKRLSTVGSGDAMVAGIAVALERGEDLVHGLALGTAAGAATAMSEGTALGTADDVAALLPQVRIEQRS